MVWMSTEIADLQEVAGRFGALTAYASAQSVGAFSDLVAEVALQDRIEAVADVLAAGVPAASLDLVAQVAAEIVGARPASPSSGVEPGELEPLVYRAGLAVRLRRPDLGEIVGELERWLEPAGAGDDAWEEDPEAGELFLQSLASGLAPLAGLDVAATLHYARIFMDNFPPFSLPLGDVDERATRWLAQLLDMGGTRAVLRQTLLDLASAWQEGHPRAAGQIRTWAEAPIPSDQTQDLPWMQALLPLARTQV
jgi:hypothetical protein